VVDGDRFGSVCRPVRALVFGGVPVIWTPAIPTVIAALVVGGAFLYLLIRRPR